MNQPKISVIMGIYNCEATLSEAIDSIISQTYTNWELIMCDDGSTDETYKVAELYRVQYPQKIKLLRNTRNMKLSYTLNQCLGAASGELIARMDGDDVSDCERLQKQVDYLQSNPEIHLVGTSMQCFDDSGRHSIRVPVKNPNPLTLRDRTPFFHATIMTYKWVYDALGGYSDDPHAERTEDIELWFRFFNQGFKGANMDEVLYYVREDYETIKRRTTLNRINNFRIRAWGFRLLGFPKRWLLKLALLTVIKILVPPCFVKWIRQYQGYMG